MKKKHHLAKILSAFSLFILLTGCTTLSYIDDDYETVKSANIQTKENFNIQTFEKSMNSSVSVKAGISETVLENALVLYIQFINNSDYSYKFDTNDVRVTSPIGEVSFIAPSSYIEAYQSYEASNYAGMVNAGATLGQFASIQNQYRRTVSSGQNIIDNQNSNISPELMALQTTIEGIQSHTLTSYKFLEPKSSEYFYIFLRKPEEYPVVVQYKNLTYKFGSKRNVKG